MIEPERTNKDTVVNKNKSKRPSDEQASVSNASIGQYIKSLRESQRLKIENIAQKTKINLGMLRALENDDFPTLPNITYLKGFVRSIVKELKGDQKEALELLLETHERFFPKEDGQEEITDQTTDDESLQNNLAAFFELIKNIPPTFYKISIAILLSVVVISFLTSKLSEISSEVSQETETKTTTKEEQPPSNVEKSTPPKMEAVAETPALEAANQEKKIETAKTEEPQTPKVKTVEEEKTPEKQETKEEEEITNPIVSAEPPQTTTPKVQPIEAVKEYEFYPIKLPMFLVENTDLDDISREILPNKVRRAAVSGKQNVFINAYDGDTWLTYKNSGGPVRTFILKKGRTLLLRGDTIRIFLGNVHVTKIFLNNKPLKIESTNGVKSLVFPELAAQQFVTPLFVRSKSGKSYTSDEYLRYKESIE